MSAAARQAQRITLVGAAVNAVLGTLKIAFGALAQSQALIADGVHSLSDLLSDAVAVLATHFGRQEADADHPYGHERIETLGTLLLGTLIILVAAGLAWDAGRTLLAPSVAPQLWLALPVALLTVLVKEALYRVTLRAAAHLGSDLLVANAWHHRSDAISSLIVIVGLCGAALGWPALDAVAAAMLCVMIAAIGARLAWRSVRELIDTAPPPAYMARLRHLAESVPGVGGVHALRGRRMAGRTLMDVHVEVPAEASVSEGHRLGLELVRRAHDEFPDLTELHYHVDPADRHGPSAEDTIYLPLRPRVLAEVFAEPLPANARAMLHYSDRAIAIDLLLPTDQPMPARAATRPEWLAELRIWRRDTAPDDG